MHNPGRLIEKLWLLHYCSVCKKCGERAIRLEHCGMLVLLYRGIMTRRCELQSINAKLHTTGASSPKHVQATDCSKFKGHSSSIRRKFSPNQLPLTTSNFPQTRPLPPSRFSRRRSKPGSNTSRLTSTKRRVTRQNCCWGCGSGCGSPCRTWCIRVISLRSPGQSHS